MADCALDAKTPTRRFHPPRLRGARGSRGGAGSILVALAVGLAVATLPDIAQAATYQCTEAQLDAALAAGGTATFDCGATTTIVVSTPKVITQSGTIIDGRSK